MSTLQPELSTMRTAVVSTEALGSRAARLGASVVDSLLVGIPAAIVGIALQSWALYFVVGTIGSLVYPVLMLSRSGEHNGQTLAKQWLSLRVVSTSGAPVTFGTACKRELLGRFLPNAVTFGAYGLPDSLWLLWDRRKQTLHDKIGGTYVFQAIMDPAQAPQLAAPATPLFTGASTPPPPPPPPPPPSA